MEDWLEEWISGWPELQRSTVERQIVDGSFISFIDPSGEAFKQRESSKEYWETEWTGKERGEWTENSLDGTALFRPVRIKLPPGIQAEALRKAALLRGVAVGGEPDDEEVIVLSFDGLSKQQIIEGLSRLAEEVAEFTGRHDSNL